MDLLCGLLGNLCEYIGRKLYKLYCVKSTQGTQDRNVKYQKDFDVEYGYSDEPSLPHIIEFQSGDYVPKVSTEKNLEYYVEVHVRRPFSKFIGGKVINKEQILELTSDVCKWENIDTNLRLLNNKSWIYVQMESIGIENQCVIMVNNVFNGLLHSFLRHYKEWLINMPKLKAIWNELHLFHPFIIEICDGNTNEENKKKEKEFLTHISNLLPARLFELELKFMKIQNDIYNFIQKRIVQNENFEIYDDENNASTRKLCIQVYNSLGQKKNMIMILRRSKKDINGVKNKATLYSIITVYFTSIKFYNKKNHKKNLEKKDLEKKDLEVNEFNKVDHHKKNVKKKDLKKNDLENSSCNALQKVSQKRRRRIKRKKNKQIK